MQDRIPSKPNRYAVYDDAHNFIRHEYHERADEPTHEGSALNKANLLPDDVAAALGLDPANNPQVKDGLDKLSKSALHGSNITNSTIGSMYVGQKESFGSDTNIYIKVIDNYPINGVSLFVEGKLVPPKRPFDAGGNSTYDGSDADNYINTTYFDSLSTELKNNIVSVPISSNNTSIYRKAFLLSATEVGRTSPDPTLITEGTVIPYLKNNPGAAPIGSTALVNYYLRSKSEVGRNYIVYQNSSSTAPSDSSSYYYRVAFALPNNYVYKTQKKDFLFDVFGNSITIGAQIETGSYVGTGMYGSDNPNSIAAGFVPKIGFIDNGFFTGVSLTYGVTTKWYSTVSASAQFNTSGTQYFYTFIG